MIANVANRLTLVLLLLCLALGTLVTRALRDAAAMPETRLVDDTQPAVDAPAAGKRPNTLPPALPTVAVQTYQEILQRPLFIRGRQPSEKPQPAPVRAPAKQLHQQLEGVAISRDTRVALLRDPRSRVQFSVEEGNLWEGWLVEQVLPDRVILSADGQVVELLLEPDDQNEQARKPGAAGAPKKP
jgi:hypothetical protein